MMPEFKADKLTIKIYPTRPEMGQEAAHMVCTKIQELVAAQEYVNVIFAAAPSQNEFLAALIEQEGIAWDRVNAFHMDEYIGLAEDAPQRFGNFLKEKIFDRLPFGSINYIGGDAGESGRYAGLLQRFPPDIVCMGIGENSHIAFNDPHVADFNDPQVVKIADLDHDCRQQQVNDSCFATLEDVPTHAITLTIPALMSGRFIYCMVPGMNKAQAVARTLKGNIEEQCPASVLRNHPNAVLFLDGDSSSLLKFKI